MQILSAVLLSVFSLSTKKKNLNTLRYRGYGVDGSGQSASMSKNSEESLPLLTGLACVNSDFKVYKQHPQHLRFEQNKLNTFELRFPSRE